jgi:uroporphyrinogen decarboxylase
MPATTALIGFCGAPFTVACYMLGSSKDGFAAALKMATEQRAFFLQLLDVLAEASAFYLDVQIRAGAEALQIFDSHAGLAPTKNVNDFIVAPTKKIVEAVKKNHPQLPIIGFPRQLKKEYLPYYVEETGVDAVSLDAETDLAWAEQNLRATLQGNLASTLMPGDEKPMLQAAENILKTLQKPFVFNLGHGLTPDAKPDNVAALVTFVQGFKR